ncbi:MAG: acyl-CoA dehydrogenase family protein [Gammaproteobacteria bacterium]|nr:acyl-CoA dehydrogenase family protein [Gammaproteobacteria bacterium]
MIPFKSPQDDILFSLRHVAEVDSVVGFDIESARDIFSHFSTLAEEIIAPLNAPGDDVGAQLINGRVQMPDGFKQAYAQLASDGWQGLTVPERFDGMGGSKFIAAGVSEIFSGANHALQMVCNLVPGAVITLLRFGSTEQQEEWIPRFAKGDVLSTMCLTEAGAGSDLSGIRTVAVPHNGSWRLTGEKLFISGGDQDLSPSILHFVLARTGSTSEGVRGLSLLLCPAQPAVRVTRLEKKLGLHASPTCQLNFDGAEAELVGKEGGGLEAMFTIMNHARIDVALQGTAHASRAASIASAYTADRHQGRRPDGHPAVLSDHPDVQRMLDKQQILAIGSRALCHISLAELERSNQPVLTEFLTSLCKVTGSEAGIEAADLGIQILGGYGYLEDYGMSQIWRDARITSIYEGTNGIHARGMVTRGLRNNAVVDDFVSLVRSIAVDSASIEAPLSEWQTMVGAIADAPQALAFQYQFLRATQRLMRNAIWNKIDSVAQHHTDSQRLKALAAQVLDGELHT